MNLSPASPEPPCDADIMRRVQGGELEAFAELIRRYQRALARVARSRLGRDDWAEEAVQETFLAALRGRHTYDPRFGFRTWLWTILLNECYRQRTRRARRPSIAFWTDHCRTDQAEQSLDDPADQATGPLENVLRGERSALIEELLGQLPPAEADTLRLRFFGELGFREIAAAMGCSLPGAKKRVRNGLLRLTKLLEQRGLHAGPDDREANDARSARNSQDAST